MEPINYDAEKSPKRILPQGWRKFVVLSGSEGTSKAGKPKVILTIKDVEAEYVEEVHLSTQPGTAWVWGHLVKACGIGKEQAPTWEIICNKEIMGLIEHEPNEYIDREGNTVKTMQHRYVDFKGREKTAWEDET
jgi:hypothetical protein